MSFDAKALVAMLRNQAVLPRKITFGKAEVMDSVQEVGFAYAVAATDPNDSF